MKNKFYVFLIIVLFFISGCSSNKNLIGRWDTVSLINESVPFDVLESDIEFSLVDNKMRINGFAGMNLYICYAKINGKNFNVYNIENTGFMGLLPAMEYEDAFFTVLSKVDYYKIEDDMLYLFSSDGNTELCFKKSADE